MIVVQLAFYSWRIFMKSLVLSFLLLMSGNLFALTNSSFSHHGYFRSGVGTNTRGGDQVCFKNPNASGNEFRLGDECDSYGELTFVGKHGAKDKAQNVKTQVTLSYGVDGHTGFEETSIAIRESYVEFKNIGEQKLSYWGGKRFYRAQDIYMNDWYYFSEMNTNGAGVGDIDLFDANLNVAFLREIRDTTSDIGSHAVSLLDMRLKGIKLTQKDSLDLWHAVAFTPSGKDTTNNIDYDSSYGMTLSLLYKRNLDHGFNHFAVMYGKGLMDEFSPFGQTNTPVASVDYNKQRNSSRMRFVEHLTLNMKKWAFHFASTLELRDSGEETNPGSTWFNVGVQPVYYFTDHYQLAGVLGTSSVSFDNAPTERLTRITIAPQIAMDKNIWGRPILRFFVTQSYWSKSLINRAEETSGGVYNNRRHGGSWGFQIESWF
jgi:maltoporin